MLSAYGKAIGQLFDPAFRRVFWRAIALSILVFAVLLVGLGQAVELLPVFEWWLLNAIVKVAAVAGGLGLTWLLFPAVSTMFIVIFLDDIVAAVERRHYPDDPPGRPLPLGRSIVLSIRFAVLVVVLNILVLPLYLVVISLPLIFYSLNGYLLGREYFELVAYRHADEATARDLRRRHRIRCFLAGVVTAVLLTVPVVNLLAPIIATAAMVHLFKRLAPAGSAPAGP